MRGNRPTGAGLIDRHDLLAQLSAKSIHHQPERYVHCTTGRESEMILMGLLG